MSEKLIDVLKSHRQADEEGSMCIVSRQAVDEAILEIEKLRAENERLREVLTKTVPIMERSLSYIEDFAKPLPPKLQREIINMIIHASDIAIDAAREGKS